MTGARRPENAKRNRAAAPKNTISRSDVERHVRLTEANDHLEISRELAPVIFAARSERALRWRYYSHGIGRLQGRGGLRSGGFHGRNQP